MIFFMILIAGPAIAIVLGLIGYIIFKNVYVTPIIVAVLTVVLSFTAFNPSFLFWSVIYALLTYISGILIRLKYK